VGVDGQNGFSSFLSKAPVPITPLCRGTTSPSLPYNACNGLPNVHRFRRHLQEENVYRWLQMDVTTNTFHMGLFCAIGAFQYIQCHLTGAG
jgi:hypothetical protein